MVCRAPILIISERLHTAGAAEAVGTAAPGRHNYSTGLCSLLGVAIELPEFPFSFSVAIRRMCGFVLVVLAHSMQGLFYDGCSRSSGLRMEQLRELE